MKPRKLWCVRVTFPSGYDVYLRRGSSPDGPIATFRDKKTADINAEFLEPGLEDGQVAMAVLYDKDLE